MEGVQDGGDAATENVLFVSHTEFLHDANGGQVIRAGDGNDALEADAVESIAKGGARDFGGDSFAPVFAGQPPANFNFVGIWERLDAAEADELTR